MFNIMILSNGRNTESTYIENLKRWGNKLEIITPENKIDSNHCSRSDIDAFIIEVIGRDDFITTCETIMRIRRINSKFIWVIAENEIAIPKKLFFDLGVDGVVSGEQEQKFLATQINNILSHSNKILSHSIENQDVQPRLANTASLLPENLSIKIDLENEISLTRLEYQVISILNKNAGKAMAYQQIYRDSWNKSSEVDEVMKYQVSNIIFRLRKKLKENSNYIKTVHSKGYMVVERIGE